MPPLRRQPAEKKDCPWFLGLGPGDRRDVQVRLDAKA
jgi:hypothetical protein